MRRSARGHDRRIGHVHRQVRRLLIAMGDVEVTTADLVEFCYPHARNRWMWRWARKAAERYAVRVIMPRGHL